MMIYEHMSFVSSPNGVPFCVRGRDSGIHFDLSVECSPDTGDNTDYTVTEDYAKYNGHNEHPADESACESRLAEIVAAIASGTNI